MVAVWTTSGIHNQVVGSNRILPSKADFREPIYNEQQVRAVRGWACTRRTETGALHKRIQLKNSFCALPPRMRARSASEANASNSSKRVTCFRYSAGVLPSMPQMMRSGPKLS